MQSIISTIYSNVLTRIILLLSFALVSNTFVYAQMDSLLSQARNPKLDVYKRLDIYKVLIEKQSKNSPILIVDYTKEALNIAIPNKEIDYAVDFLLAKGRAFQIMGQRDSAYAVYQQALSLAVNNPKKLGQIYNAMGRFFRKLVPERALVFYEKAMHQFETISDSSGIAMIYNESGVAYEYVLNYKEALNRYQQSLALQTRLNDSVGIGYALEFIGGVYTKMKHFKEAETYLQSALQYRKALADTFALAYNYWFLGNLNLDQNNSTKALVNYRKSIAFNLVIDNSYALMQNYEKLSELFQQTKQTDSALYYLKKYYTLKDEMFTTEKETLIESLYARYDTKQKELTITEQNNVIANRNKWIMAIVALLLIAAIVVRSLFKRHQLKQQLVLEQVKAQQQDVAAKAILETEERERYRIAHELHDGIGQMMSAAKMNLSYILEHSEPESDKKVQLRKVVNMVDDAYQELRHISHNMTPYAMEKKDFSTALFSLINKIDAKVLAINLYTEGLDQPLSQSTASVLYRIIQESVNNVMKHARANRFDIAIIKDAGGIHITLEDNGIGFNMMHPDFKEGAGLNSIRTRVSYLKGVIDVDSSEGNGTLIAVHIPN